MRHGRTEWNNIHRFQGSTDIPLNETGMEQANAAALRLKEWPLDAVYTSPLTRARQTAEIIASPHLKTPMVLNDLREVSFGSWEGISFKNLLEQKDEALLRWLADPFFCIPAGAEEWESVRLRAELVMNQVLNSGHKRAAIVSHGGMIRALLVVFLGFDPHSIWKIKASNCSLTGIEVREHETSLAFANDTLHLSGTSAGDCLPMW